MKKTTWAGLRSLAVVAGILFLIPQRAETAEPATALEPMPWERAQAEDSPSEGEAAAYDQQRAATVFRPGAASKEAASKGFEAPPQGIYWDIIVHGAVCSCTWDACVHSRWSDCYQSFCMEYGC